MQKSVAYAIYSANLLEMALDTGKKCSNEIRRRRRLLPQSPPDAGGALSRYSAGASRGNRRDPEHPGKLPPPPLDRAETRRPRREPERTQLPLASGPPPRPTPAGRPRRNNPRPRRNPWM